MRVLILLVAVILLSFSSKAQDLFQVESSNTSRFVIGPSNYQTSSGLSTFAHHIYTNRDLVINLDSTGINGDRAFSIRLQPNSGVIGRGTSLLIADKYGNIGIGNFEPSIQYPINNPKAKLHIRQGDVYIEDISSGVIMKSPNGQCWRVTVDDNGKFSSTLIACPN